MGRIQWKLKFCLCFRPHQYYVHCDRNNAGWQRSTCLQATQQFGPINARPPRDHITQCSYGISLSSAFQGHHGLTSTLWRKYLKASGPRPVFHHFNLRPHNTNSTTSSELTTPQQGVEGAHQPISCASTCASCFCWPLPAASYLPKVLHATTLAFTLLSHNHLSFSFSFFLSNTHWEG